MNLLASQLLSGTQKCGPIQNKKWPIIRFRAYVMIKGPSFPKSVRVPQVWGEEGGHSLFCFFDLLLLVLG